MSSAGEHPALVPLTVQVGDREIIGRLTEGAGVARDFDSTTTFAWIHGSGGRDVVIDMGAMVRLNSTLIRWLLECRTLSGAPRIVVRGANQAVRVQFKQLGLERLFVLE